jgi:hypothetical protein
MQLKYLKCPRLHSNISKSLLDILDTLNQQRFLSGADNRLLGIQLSRIQPSCVVFFTASPKMSSSSVAIFKTQQ